jgi:HEAT repeat protein
MGRLILRLAVAVCFLVPGLAARAEDDCAKHVTEAVTRMAAGSLRGAHLNLDELNLSIWSAYGESQCAVIAVGRAAIPHLLALLASNDKRVVVAAADCLFFLGGPDDRKAAAAAVERVRPGLPQDDVPFAFFLHTILTGELPADFSPHGVGGTDNFAMLVAWLEFARIKGLEKALIPYLSHEDDYCRQCAARVLLVRKCSEALPAALQQFPKETNSWALEYEGQIVMKYGNAEECRAVVPTLLSKKRLSLRTTAMEGIIRHKLEEFVPQLDSLHHKCEADKLARTGMPAAFELLQKWARSDCAVAREKAAGGLAANRDPRWTSLLLELSDDDSQTIRSIAIGALVKLAPTSPEANEAVVEIGKRRTLSFFDKSALHPAPPAPVRRNPPEALPRISKLPGHRTSVDDFLASLPEDEDVLIRSLQSMWVEERLAATVRLAKVGTAKAILPLEDACHDLCFVTSGEDWALVGAWQGGTPSGSAYPVRRGARKALETIRERIKP